MWSLRNGVADEAIQYRRINGKNYVFATAAGGKQSSATAPTTKEKTITSVRLVVIIAGSPPNNWAATSRCSSQ